MSTSAKLQRQLQTILSGNAWYGTPIYSIIDEVSFETAYEKAEGASHSIAAILLHMLAWTEEAIKRLQFQKASEPARGDWPDPGTPDEQKWQQLINDFKLTNTDLLALIEKFDDSKWPEATNDDRGTYSGDEASYEALINGLIQHHVYHAGQISLLNKMING
jgi:uncharacterized damage-inducible protein DinB